MKMAQIMAQTIIPIRFRFLSLPVAWSAGTSAKLGPVVCGRIQKWKSSPEEVRLTELDGWQLRDEFFDLHENDLEALTRFLSKAGVWSSSHLEPPDWYLADPLSVYPADVWLFRDELKAALLHPKGFAAGVTPKQAKTKTLLDLMAPHPANLFALRFELSDVAAGVVTLTNARQMLFATVLADVTRGIRFKTCKRKDCEKPFAIESGHKRDYCGQYCGHLESVRRGRKAKRKPRTGKRV